MFFPSFPRALASGGTIDVEWRFHKAAARRFGGNGSPRLGEADARSRRQAAFEGW
jgi:hypothetical protein